MVIDIRRLPLVPQRVMPEHYCASLITLHDCGDRLPLPLEAPPGICLPACISATGYRPDFRCVIHWTTRPERAGHSHPTHNLLTGERPSKRSFGSPGRSLRLFPAPRFYPPPSPLRSRFTGTYPGVTYPGDTDHHTSSVAQGSKRPAAFCRPRDSVRLLPNSANGSRFTVHGKT